MSFLSELQYLAGALTVTICFNAAKCFVLSSYCLSSRQGHGYWLVLLRGRALVIVRATLMACLMQMTGMSSPRELLMYHMWGTRCVP